MAADAVGAALEAARLPLSALGLGAARLFGLLSILPLSTRLGLTGLLRAGTALGLALPLAPALVPALGPAPLPGAHLALLAVKEAFIGVVLGIAFAGPFWAAEAAGGILDQQRGSTSAALPDAAGTAQAGITATLLVLTLTTIFLLSGGMRLLLDGVFDSYRAWPAAELVPHFAPDAGLQALAVLDHVLSAGLVLASPLLIAMLLAELSLALIGRFAPQLHVFDVALAVKGLVYIMGLPIYAVFLIGDLRGSLAPFARFGDVLRRLSGG